MVFTLGPSVRNKVKDLRYILNMYSHLTSNQGKDSLVSSYYEKDCHRIRIYNDNC